MDIRILDVGLEVCRGVRDNEWIIPGNGTPGRPFCSRPMFSSKIHHLKGRKMLRTNPPHLSSDGKRHGAMEKGTEKDVNYIGRLLSGGQVLEVVQGAGVGAAGPG